MTVNKFTVSKSLCQDRQLGKQAKFFQGCLVMEPDSRLTCAELLEHKYFDGFRERFEPELQALMSKNQDQHQTKSKKQKVNVS